MGCGAICYPTEKGFEPSSVVLAVIWESVSDLDGLAKMVRCPLSMLVDQRHASRLGLRKERIYLSRTKPDCPARIEGTTAMVGTP